jgi:hypothetical protein
MQFCLYEFLRDQGSFIAGVLALIAGIMAYRAGRIQATATNTAAEGQLNADRLKEEREIYTIRKSLATEIRLQIGHALAAHNLLRALATSASATTSITAREVESSSHVSGAVIYPAVASRIGLLGGSDAMDVVIIYNLIETGRAYADQLIRGREPDNISPRNVAAVADAFLAACRCGKELLPKLSTGFALHDEKDGEQIKKIDRAIAEWDQILKQWPRNNQA